jgi:glycosyltransferase involved in cell wall biosynthesis
MELKKDLVTIYILSHRYGRFAQDAILSAVNQTYENIEIILIDNGSRDTTASVFQQALIYPRVKMIITNREDIGLIRAANQALKTAKGKYIMRLDADDYLKANAVEKMMDNPATLNFSGFRHIDEFNKVLDGNRQHLDTKWHGACCLIDRGWLIEQGGYDEEFDCQDGHYLKLIAMNEKQIGIQIGIIKDELFFYRIHSTSLSHDHKKIDETRKRLDAKYK